jgi:hypothetical protein
MQSAVIRAPTSARKASIPRTRPTINPVRPESEPPPLLDRMDEPFVVLFVGNWNKRRHREAQHYCINQCKFNLIF